MQKLDQLSRPETHSAAARLKMTVDLGPRQPPRGPQGDGSNDHGVSSLYKSTVPGGGGCA